MKNSYKNVEFKTSALTWIEYFELTDRSYSLSYIPDYFKYITKKHEIVTDNLTISIYMNKIVTGVTF